MKRLFSILLFAFAVQHLNAQFPVVVVPPPASANINVGPVGITGYSTYYYMVIANYPSGSMQSQVFTLQNGNATLTSGNYNQIGWQALPGVTSFDILRLPTNSFTGTCTCSLAVTQSATTYSYSDIGGSLSSYTVAAPPATARQQFVLDNTDYSFPKLRTIVTTSNATVNHLAEIISGATLPTFCQVGDMTILTAGAGAGNYNCLTANTWTPGSASGGGAIEAITMTAGTGGTTASQLVKISGATVVKTLTTDTAPDVAFGISLSTATATSPVLVAIGGVAPCVADTGGITAGDLVGAGTTVADTCVDLGQTLVTSVAPNIAILGRALTTSLATATSQIYLFPQTGAGYATNGTGNYSRGTGNSLIDCAVTAACPSTAQTIEHSVIGRGTLASGTPSTYVVTTLSPAFTSATTYLCWAQDTTTIANNVGVLTAGYVSGSAVTFTGPNTNTDTFRFSCTGY